MNKGKTVVLASAVIQDKEGRVILLRRNSKNKTFKGCWQFPEGKMEFGEGPEQALKREIKEELGLDILEQHLLFTDTSSFSISTKKYSLIRIVFKVRYKGNISLDDEHDKYKWFNPTILPANLKFVEGTKEVLRKVA